MALSSFKLTDKGRSLWNKVAAGRCKLNITELRIGSGALTEEAIPTMTSLVEEKAKFAPGAITEMTDKSGVCVSVAISNKSAVDAAYTWTESALYATDPDEGSIILAAACGGTETIPQYESGYPYSITHNIFIGVNDASTVTITTSSDSFVTQGALDTAIANLKATLDASMVAITEDELAEITATV